MVKFAKQLKLLLVPEWKNAFCDYWKLKKILKSMKPFSKPLSNVSDEEESEPMGVITYPKEMERTESVDRQSHQHTIQIQSEQDIYETTLNSGLAEDKHQTVFFASLDAELNKVNQFFCTKEQEFVQRRKVLHEQLHNLENLRKTCATEHINSPSDNIDRTLHGIKCPQAPNKLEVDSPPVIDSDTRLDVTSNKNSTLEDISKCNSKAWSMDGRKATSCAIRSLPNVFCKNVPVTQEKGNGCGMMKLNKRKLKNAEKMLRNAYVEFYRGLELLNNFRSLNMLAFTKILKKYDKVTGMKVSQVYLKVVETCPFNSSYVVVNMMDEAEKLLETHFCQGDHKNAMMLLRPTQRATSLRRTFSLGAFTGSSITFIALFGLLLLLPKISTIPIYTSKLQQYNQPTYFAFSSLFLIVLHMFMYAWNVYMWSKFRINYAFILGFNPKTFLRTSQVLLLCACLACFFLCGIVAYLIITLYPSSPFNSTIIPIPIILIFLSILFCPFNVFYRSSRFFFINCMKRIIASPFYKVTMVDFFLADQLTSQMHVFLYLKYIMCYYFSGLNAKYSSSRELMFLTYMMPVLPYWWRFLQCLRQFFDTHNMTQLANAGKYLAAIIAIGTNWAHSYNPSGTSLVVFVVMSTIATIYQLYWDFVMDWGLLQPYSKNRWLRDELILNNKNIYILSIAINVLFRCFWLQLIMQKTFNHANQNEIDLLFASIEILRRGHWNFYRLENEHLNNVGMYRAVKAVPLPF